ncbi:MAG: PocR ligand-binding domain-containing protein [Bacillota bacterium]
MSNVSLFTLIEKEKLENILTALHSCIELPIQVIDASGELLLGRGDDSEFCHKFSHFLPPEKSCKQVHCKASERAILLGESYVFPCPGNLNHIVFPLLNETSLVGSVLIGPFLMVPPDSTLISELLNTFSVQAIDLLELYDLLQEIAVVTPQKIQQISRLLDYLLNPLLGEHNEEFMINHIKGLQQSKINESIQMYKRSGGTSQNTYPYKKEQALISKIKMGAIKEAKDILNDLLGYILYDEGKNLEALKIRSIELCSLFSRAAIEGGAPSSIAFNLNHDFLESILKMKNSEDLAIKLEYAIEAFSRSISVKAQDSGKQQEVIQKAANYISTHYAERLSLEEVANHVGLNASYFSTLFKESTGTSFKEHLNAVRVEESKKLLAHTTQSVIHIASAVGFEDQGYFTKVFKKYTGLTPKQFR